MMVPGQQTKGRREKGEGRREKREERREKREERIPLKELEDGGQSCTPGLCVQ
jgi:hypothetical protein